jgi:peptidoglycan/xylan/chitin deacetylase (PgdA/CDA1 family)
MLARRQRAMRVLMIHSVDDSYCSVDAFREQLLYVRRHFEIVSLEELVRRLAAGESRGREVALTFDDGLRNTLDCAYPVLQSLRVPATIFVCPGLIGSGIWLWNQEARARLFSLDPATLAALAKAFGAAAEVEAVINWMKTLPLPLRQDAERRIRDASPAFTPSARQKGLYDLMDWDDLASLDPELITLGAHTLTHPILTTLPDAELDHEIGGSRAVLEERLRRPIRYFCYPNGAHDPRAVAAAKRHFEAAVTTETRMVRGSSCPHRIPRIALADSASGLAWLLWRPGA